MTAGSASPANPAALVGSTVGNTFALEKLLGQGRHGALFDARHTRLGQRYAVRVLGLDANRRAALMSALSQCSVVVHPNLVPVREVMALPDEKFALCTPLLPGVNLGQRVSAQGKLTVAEGTVLMRQAISALHALHQRGLVHGNLSAGNIFFTQHDDISVDNALGSAKSGQIVQLLDPALQLCEAQTGAPLTAADDQQALGKLVLAHVSDLSPGQRRALERTQEARAEARYPSVLGLWQAFDGAKAPGKRGPGAVGSVATALVPQIKLRKPVGGRNLAIAAAVGVGLAAVAVVAFVLLGKPAHDPATAAVPVMVANAEVHLAFDVTPATATVTLNGNTTPAIAGLTLPRSANPVSLTFSAEGYQGKILAVTPSGARTVAVTLIKVAAPEPGVDSSKPAAEGDDEADGSRKHKKREHHHRHKGEGGADATDKDGALPALMKIKK